MPPFTRVAIFSDVILVSNYYSCKGEAINLIPHYRYHLQNCKAITFRKIINHIKYKEPNVPSHLHIFWSNFDKAISFLHLFRLGGNAFSKTPAWRFESGTVAWVKMHRFSGFSSSVNTLNWKIPLHTLYLGFKETPFILYTYVLAKILQNGAKFVQKLAAGFKLHEELGQLQTSSEKFKKLKFDGLLLSKKCICPKNTFLQLKHYIQRIYLTLLSTTCVKIN